MRRADPARLALLPELRALAARPAASRPRLRGDGDRARPQALMASEADERRTAIAAADTTCPRCGAGARRDRPLLPGLRAPAAGRRGHGRRRCAAAGCGGSAGTRATGSGCRCRRCSSPRGRRRRDRRSRTTTREANAGRAYRRAGAVSVGEPRSPSRPPQVDRRHGDAPRSHPSPAAAPRARTVASHGRRRQNGWTIVLVSYPKASGRATALATATRAAKANLRQVGIIDSGGFASLQPGYFVVFSGIYGVEARRRRGVCDSPPGGVRRRLLAARSRAERRCVSRAVAGMAPTGSCGCRCLQN